MCNLNLLLILWLEFDFDIALRRFGNCACSSVDAPTQNVAEVDYGYRVEGLVDNDCLGLVLLDLGLDDCIFKTALNLCGVRESDVVVFNAVDCKGYILLYI